MTARSLRFLFASMLAWSAAVPPAIADEIDEVGRLHQAGQSTSALDQADRFLRAHPRDPRMRFLQAAILVDQLRRAEATVILERLVEDYPDLAEPYNNLANLYADAGELSKARAALEQALRIKPDFAVAHENLGDVHAALAGRAYAAALRLEPGRTGTPAKLSMVRELFSTPRARAPEASGATGASTPLR